MTYKKIVQTITRGKITVLAPVRKNSTWLVRRGHTWGEGRTLARALEDIEK